MRPITDIKNDIAQRLIAALNLAKAEGELNFEEIPSFVIEIPREQAHGDFAANVAMVMAKQARMAPRKIAEVILAKLDTEGSYIDRTEIAGAGFINFFLKNDWLFAVPRLVHEMGDRYGSVETGKGKRVQVEFVSANPTGLLHMGNARGGAIGDSLGNLLAFAGYDVEKEFYINDAGNQIRLLGVSLDARFRELLGEEIVFPEDGYHGDDIIETVKHYINENGTSLREKDVEEREQVLADYALAEKLADIKRVLSLYGVNFDIWFSERSLHDSGKVLGAMQDLKERGIAYEKDGSLLLKAENSEAGKQSKEGERINLEDKDDVLIRSNGIPTYFAADIAYHKDKFDRGFDKV
ncbi:MAG: arginine--tRNA ligase, partial [Firmicutes bacterium]|nr:arginine--tRNA ligase [Bacillota bacterium]